MLAWTVVVGSSEQLLPTKAIIAAPFLSVLGGDCVFNSLTLSLASDLTEDRVLRCVPCPVACFRRRLKLTCAQGHLLRLHELDVVCGSTPGSRTSIG
jgi:hypothetical protein